GALFLLWLALSPLEDPILAVEAGYCSVTAVLALALWRIELGGRRGATGAPAPASAAAAA
ncbi:MAG: hypothetical protein AVDCRST_MAG38-2886, partial [uncultured Solirubrobacteraceae bacterium]